MKLIMEAGISPNPLLHIYSLEGCLILCGELRN